MCLSPAPGVALCTVRGRHGALGTVACPAPPELDEDRSGGSAPQPRIAMQHILIPGWKVCYVAFTFASCRLWAALGMTVFLCGCCV